MSDTKVGEGEGFESLFASQFGTPKDGAVPFGDPANLTPRRKRDKRSGQSAKQRARKSTRDQQFNMRCSAEFKAVAAAKAEKRGISIADLLHELILTSETSEEES